MNFKNHRHDVVQVKVRLKEGISRSAFSKLLEDLVKHLLLLKSQIPLQFEAIVKEVELDDRNTLAGHLEETDDCGDMEAPPASREEVKKRLQRARAQRSRAHLLKNGRKLLSDFSFLSTSLTRELAAEDVVSVSFVFGATCHSAREVYTVEVPRYEEGETSARARPGLQLYRAMVGHTQLEAVTDRRLPVSNMFTLICKRSLPTASSSLHLPDYVLPTSRRCGRVNLRLTTPDLKTVEATRRLIGLTTPAVSREPVSMELCTPCPPSSTSDSPDVASSHRDNPLEASSHQDNPVEVISHQDMELCTPIQSQTRARRQETLSLASLTLLSPQKKSKLDDEDREDEQLYWFLLETSIRGFKLKL